jgi:uncharacterized iron-regulated membrane protein
MHGDLHLGETGQLYSEFVASWLPVIIAGGLILWFGRRRKRRRDQPAPAPKQRKTGRARLRSLHSGLGLWLALGLIAVSITGLTWSQHAGSRFSDAIAALDGKSPSLAAADVPLGTGTPISVTQVLGIATAQGLDGQLTITPPKSAADPYTVKESENGLPVHRESIAVDPYRAEVTERLGWSDYPMLAKLTTLGIQAHSGQLLGLANQIAMALLALGTLALLAVGYRMWWQRRPGRATVAPIPAQAWHRFGQPAVFLIVLATVALAWVIPVLGVTLGAFLIVDAVRNTFKRRRAQRV